MPPKDLRSSQNSVPDGSLDTFLAGSDVVANTFASSGTPQFQTGLLHAILCNGMKVYFPSELGGYDVIQNLFPGYGHPERVKKGELERETHTILDRKVKVVHLDTGGFLSWMAGSGRNMLVHQPDVGRSVAQVTLLALDPATAAAVPARIRIAGNIIDTDELQGMAMRVKCIPKGEVVCKDIAAAKEALMKVPNRNTTG